MWMALPRHGWGREYRTADNAPCTVERQARHHEWVANRTDVSKRSLRRRSQIYGCIRLIESSLRQVDWWYSGSTKDSCQKKQNQHPTVSFHGHVTQLVESYSRRHRMSNGVLLTSRKSLVVLSFLSWNHAPPRGNTLAPQPGKTGCRGAIAG